jgi:Cu(I)/Ag(I) efflux system membrane fusion protein
MNTARLQQFRAPAISVVATASLLGAVLLMQHLRHGWPFSLHMVQAAASVGSTADAAAAANPHAGHVAPAPDRVGVDIDASAMDRVGLRLQPVQAEMLTQPLRAVATVVPDETRISHAHTRVAGWVEELLVNTTGQPVRAGEPLARIFSQELLSSQTEYLTARRQAASGLTSAVVESGRTRLKVLGMTDAEIDEIERAGTPIRLVTVVAPRTGVVVHRGISVGTAVDPSIELITVADLSSVWILAEVPEADAPAVTVGTLATVEFTGSGRAAFAARVAFIYPTLTERTRTVRVRLATSNASGALRPGLYGTADFQIKSRRVLTVPRDAVVDTGRAQHVFISTGPGRFEPRTVTLGARLSDRVEIAQGLSEGDRIVAAGVFLLDSESRLRASGSGTGHSHSSTTAAPSAAPAPADPHAGHRK